MSSASHDVPVTNDTPEYREHLLAGPRKLSLLAAAVGLGAFVVLGLIFSASGQAKLPEQYFLSYLTGFTFWVSVGVGSLFFLLIQYLTGGRWGILMRRVFEANTRTLLLGFLLFIPVAATMLWGDHSIYWWAKHDHSAESEAKPKAEPKKAESRTVRESVAKPNLHEDSEKKKAEYLNPPFSVGRGIAWFVILGVIVLALNANAVKAETDPDLAAASKARNRQKVVASAGLMVFPLVLTFMATDWIMSLEETFASSMFPVIVFDNAGIISYAMALLMLLWLKTKNDSRFVSLFPATEQIHLGSLFLAFTLAWTYFNFSQYMLIWIGNLPEEIPYYLKRTKGGWGWYAVLLTIFHFFVPFLLLLFRHVKSNPVALKWIARGLLVVCFCDVMWWISPSMSHEGQSLYWLMDISAWVGVGGLWLWYFFGQLKKYPLLPTREVYLLEAYHHGH